MIWTVGLNDGEISHDVLDVDRVGLRVLVKEVDLALCIRDLELDPGVDPGGVEHIVVKPDEVVVLLPCSCDRSWRSERRLCLVDCKQDRGHSGC